MKRRTALLLLLGAATTSAVALAQSKPAALTTVPHVQLNRYVGRWYEIAKYPARFERDCDRDTIATYVQFENGDIEITNQCIRQDGSTKIAKGKAHTVDATNSKLKVTFFWPFYGDYWIVDLDPQYRWAVVGEPHRKYLWILSRVPHMDPATLAEIKSRLPQKGYDPNKLMMTKQTTK